MVNPISLMNLEYQLYGGMSGLNPSCPSFANGYMAQAIPTGVQPYFNPSFNGYNNQYNNPYNSSAQLSQYQNALQNGSALNNITSQGVQQTSQNTNQATFQAKEILAKDYAKHLDPAEGLVGSVATQVPFAVMMNPRLIAHPINSFNALKNVNEMFKGVKGVKGENSALKTLWLENSNVMEEAYFRMHKLEARSNGWKFNLIRKRYGEAEYKQLRQVMEDALNFAKANPKSPEALKKIAEASKTLEKAYVNDGYVANFFKNAKNWFSEKVLGKEVVKAVSTPDKISNIITDSKVATSDISKEITKGATELVEKKGQNFFKTLGKSCIGKGSIFFAGIEVLMNFGKLKTAWSKDTETGLKQSVQTGVKAAGSALGWAAGEAASIWAWGKLGATVGTYFGPGVGTAIGGAIGLIGGTIGMWAAGKLTKSIVGEDVANEIEGKNLASTTEGQVQLIQAVQERLNNGEKVDQNTIAAAQLLAQTLQRA